jgi:N-succinyldiaminopimelate aminotransferase
VKKFFGDSEDMSVMSQRVAGFGTTVFVEINNLARQHNAVNLGQGAPDFDGPPEVLVAAVEAVNSAMNQYAPGIGMLSVRQAIARHAQRFYGQKLNPETEVLVTSGATEGVFAAILGLSDPGDEVIVFEPVYDTYVPNMVMAGVTPRYVPLRGDNWTFDPDELARAFNSRTRAVIVNSPHNPTGKVYTRDELRVIADLCVKHNVIAITDEVYEHILYDDAVHTRLATLPGMEDRTVTISSLGKTQRHGLEDRLGRRSRRFGKCRQSGAPIHHLCGRFALAGRRRDGAQSTDFVF